MAEMLDRRKIRGQASVETALVLVFGIVPLTIGLIAFTEAAWTYHGLASLTRLGAQYAATHCFQDSAGQNVVEWLTDSTNRFTGEFADSTATIAWSASQASTGFTFTSDPALGSTTVSGVIGHERNGKFFS